MIKRNKYLNDIRGFYDSDLVKVITGIRRSGKSVLLEQISEEVAKSSKKIIFLNFEDLEDRLHVQEKGDLSSYVKHIKKQNGDKPNEKYYIFLDEVHELEDWAVHVRSLRLNNSVFVTGSNSKLLSLDYLTELSGRFVSFTVRPFVYQEIVEYCKELNITPSISDYLLWGGFPKRFELNEQDQLKYLQELNQTIVYKDLITRFSIRNIELFKGVVDYVLRSNARIASANSIYKAIKQTTECSQKTISTYITHIQSAYLISSIKQYSTKTKNELNFFEKTYDTDNSLNFIRATNGQYDLTHNFENAVYNELLFLGYELRVYKMPDCEIDFIASKDGKTFLIQAAYSVVDKKAYEREFKPFSKIDNTYKKILITNDDLDFSTSTVKHIPFSEFVMSGLSK